MQFSNKKKAVAGAMIAVGGLALVGVGTGAAFTDTVTANSTFKAGTVDLDIIDAPNYDISTDGNTATLKRRTVNFNTPGGRVLFDTIKVINNGDIKVPLNVDVNDDRARHHHGHERVGADKNSNPVSELAPGDSAFISICVRLRRSPTPTPARPGPSASPCRAPSRDSRNQLIPDPPASPSSPSRFGGAGCTRACRTGALARPDRAGSQT